jgi:hypothetical protein
VTRSIAGYLSLAAAPTFAVMALLTGIFTESAPDLCSVRGGSPFGGMAPMYALMCVFHAAPWLRLMTRTRREG